MWETVSIKDTNLRQSGKQTGFKFPTAVINSIEEKMKAKEIDNTLFKDAKEYIFQVLASLVAGFRQQEGNLK
jgi:hypothetical protein